MEKNMSKCSQTATLIPYKKVDFHNEGRVILGGSSKFMLTTWFSFYMFLTEINKITK